MIKYNIMNCYEEVNWRDSSKIKTGVACDTDYEHHVLVASFDTLEEAQEEFKKYKTSISELSGSSGKYYLINEYYIDELKVEEDDDVIERLGIYDITEMKIEVIEEETQNTLGLFDNYDDAYELYHKYSTDEDYDYYPEIKFM